MHIHQSVISWKYKKRLTRLQDSTYDTVAVGRTLRKVDWRLLPVLTVLCACHLIYPLIYPRWTFIARGNKTDTALDLLSFIDRGNIGNAKVAGMNTDLGMF